MRQVVRGILRMGVLCTAFSAGLLGAQRLPAGVVPEHYSLALTPDLRAATFQGDETIDVELTAPANTITLNAAEITFASVAARAGAKELKAAISEDKGKEQATFTFAQTLPAGPVKLHIRYSGVPERHAAWLLSFQDAQAELCGDTV